MTTGAYEDLDNEIKNVYGKAELEPFYRLGAKYRNDLKRKTDFLEAQGLPTFGMRTKGMHGYGIIGDVGNFPAGKDPTTLPATITPEFFVNSIQVGLKAKAMLKSKTGTYFDGGTAADRVELAAEETASYVNKVYAGTTRGRLCTVTADGTDSFTASAVNLLNEGQVLEGYTAHTSGSVRDSFSAHEITTIDPDTLVVGYQSFATQAADDKTLVAGDSIYISGTYAMNPIGLLDIVDDGTNAATIHNITRSTHPRTKANVLGNGGQKRALSMKLIFDAMERPQSRANKRITKILGGPGQWQMAYDFLSKDGRYAMSSTSPQGFSGGGDENAIKFSYPGINATLELERDCPSNTLFFLAWDTFFLLEAQAPDWITEGSSMWHLIPGSSTHKAGVRAYFGSIENQGCSMPIANSRLDDLYEPSEVPAA